QGTRQSDQVGSYTGGLETEESPCTPATDDGLIHDEQHAVPPAQGFEVAQPAPAQDIDAALAQYGLDDNGCRLFLVATTEVQLPLQIGHCVDVRAEAAVVRHEQRIAHARTTCPHRGGPGFGPEHLATGERYDLMATGRATRHFQGSLDGGGRRCSRIVDRVIPTPRLQQVARNGFS